jgi:hypothetical protein
MFHCVALAKDRHAAMQIAALLIDAGADPEIPAWKLWSRLLKSCATPPVSCELGSCRHTIFDNAIAREGNQDSRADPDFARDLQRAAMQHHKPLR